MFPGWAELQALATNSSGVQGMPTVTVLTSGAGVTDAQGIGSLLKGPKPLGSQASGDTAVEADEEAVGPSPIRTLNPQGHWHHAVEVRRRS